jgi:capsular polysaccharide transport system permease protein
MPSTVVTTHANARKNRLIFPYWGKYTISRNLSTAIESVIVLKSFLKFLVSLLKNRLFITTVFAPSLFAIVYYGFIASDVYISESRFVVRNPERQTLTGLGALFRSAGFARSQDDSQTVQEYIQSRDALKRLNEQSNLADTYRSSRVDSLSRFAGLDTNNSFEALYRYYLKKVNIRTDSATSISVLTVRSFTPDSAYKANQALLEQSEALVNRLNERGRQDLVKYATQELDAAQKKASSAALALAQYRNTQNVIDPERQATLQFQQLAKLQDELLSVTLQINQLLLISPQNPQIPVLQNRAQLLNKEIAAENNRITGPQKSLSNKASEFQRLQLESEFTNRQLASTFAGLEAARNEAQRQQVYLEIISQPNIPDSATEPKRLSMIAAVVVFSLLLWGICALLLAAAKEHNE